MSVEALRLGPLPRRLLPRLAVACGALAAVGGFVALALWLATRGAPPVPTRNPFGIGMREAAPSAATAFGRLILSWQSAFYIELRGALSAIRESGHGLPLLVAIGFLYGVFHAAGPGHGKAIIASYIVSNERALARGLLVSGLAALIQAGLAIGLVAVVFMAIGGTAAALSRTADVVEIAGFGLVGALGAFLLWRKSGKLVALAEGGSPDGGPAGDPCACGPVDPRSLARSSLREMLVVAIGAGIRPCAGAIVVLTFARAQGLAGAGIAAVLAMALGTAVTTGSIAVVSVYAKRLALRLASSRGRGAALAGAAAEVAAAAFVLVIGLALMAGYWDAGGMS